MSFWVALRPFPIVARYLIFAFISSLGAYVLDPHVFAFGHMAGRAERQLPDQFLFLNPNMSSRTAVLDVQQRLHFPGLLRFRVTARNALASHVFISFVYSNQGIFAPAAADPGCFCIHKNFGQSFSVYKKPELQQLLQRFLYTAMYLDNAKRP